MFFMFFTCCRHDVQERCVPAFASQLDFDVDLTQVFVNIGLGVRADRTHWNSTLAPLGELLTPDECRVCVSKFFRTWARS